MERDITSEKMPNGYEYLNDPLDRAQQHVFLINAEMARLENNPVFEDKLVKLQEEKQIIIANTRQEFELQTYADGPDKTAEVEAVIAQRFSNNAYQMAKDDLSRSGKDYATSEYWQDKFDRNIQQYRSMSYGLTDVDRDNLGYLDPAEDFGDLDKG